MSFLDRIHEGLNPTDLTHTVRAHAWGIKKYRDAGARHLGRGRCWLPGNMPLAHVCYHTKFRRRRSNRLSVCRVTKNWGTLGPRPLWTRAWLTPRNIIITMIMTSGWGLRKDRPARSQKIQYTKNKNLQWSSAKVTHELNMLLPHLCYPLNSM